VARFVKLIFILPMLLQSGKEKSHERVNIGN
jgi:hypothetical protein